MKIDARVEAWASLQLTTGVSPRDLVALLKAFGGPEQVLEASRASVARVVASDVATALERGPDPELRQRTLEWLADEHHSIVAWGDPDYPQSLLTIPDPPPALYCVGSRDLLDRRSIAIVGSRNATPQGIENALAFATALSSAGLTIVSGLAMGIDAAAHRGGLAGASSSIAVVGTGLDRVYPARNRDLAIALAERGALVSEFPIGTPPQPGNFPRRNRVISGLSCGVLVVEATLASGSLITARLAVDQGRDVFALPGSIHSPFSKGPHRLIKDGAKLVESAADVLGELGVVAAPAAAKASATASASTPTGDTVLTALGHDVASVDTLTARTGLPAESITAALVELEIAGAVSALPGGIFQRLH